MMDVGLSISSLYIKVPPANMIDPFMLFIIICTGLLVLGLYGLYVYLICHPIHQIFRMTSSRNPVHTAFGDEAVEQRREPAIHFIRVSLPPLPAVTDREDTPPSYDYVMKNSDKFLLLQANSV
jgi:hypothetical protein